MTSHNIVHSGSWSRGLRGRKVSLPAVVHAARSSTRHISGHVLQNDAAGVVYKEPIDHWPSSSMSESNGDEGVNTFATLLVQCPDTTGVVASVAQLLYGLKCNIVESDQFTDFSNGTFFQRVTFDYQDTTVGPGNAGMVLRTAMVELARRYNMDWTLSFNAQPKRMAILVSKLDHCLYDLLIRHRNGELKCDIPIVISNHATLQPVADMFGIPFRHIPVQPGNKAQHEQQMEEAFDEFGIDMIVLARYMQIVSPEFCERHYKHAINIHHSFLPAFEGARPYHRAHERGVKVIGATAHYVTSELDAGPIIAQDITRITHRDTVADMMRKGKDLERLVLARAVRSHLNDRVLVHGNKTVVFEE